MPVRMTVDVYSIIPRRPVLELEPVVSVKGVADLNPAYTQKDLPLWFKAKVKLYLDGSHEILEFDPLHGTVHGSEIGGRATDIYEHAFHRALIDTQLKVLDVVR